MENTILKFPWLGVFASLTFIFLLISINDPYVVEYVDASLLNQLGEYKNKLLLFALVICCIIYDFLRYREARRKFNKRARQQKEQLDELFKTRNSLQNKAQRYSGDADKLKLFISDRLLEYIEYDEKFLHFKNIAAEIRHNGIISYDKVMSILKHELEKGLPADEKRKYQDALDSMVYLWDLLDLSTTDNIALYIANKLYECEEIYYRQILDNNKESPFAPSFPALPTIVRSLQGFVEDANQLSTETITPGEPFHYEDDHFWVELEDVGNFLGNENYIVLVMENMINNGLYYTGQKKYKTQHARISLRAYNENNNAVLKIYNPGPEIAEDTRDKIYQLGYTTKRSKGQQGKGLGLYFVKQIVNGYEGNIDFVNVRNIEETFVLRIECENGTVVNEIIQTTIDSSGKLCCIQNDEQIKKVKFRLEEQIRSVEVSTNTGKQTHKFERFEKSEKTRFLDPDQADRPAWYIDVLKGFSFTEIDFKVLDTRGVEFTITIPTAESRLDPDYHDTDHRNLNELDELDENFSPATRKIS